MRGTLLGCCLTLGNIPFGLGAQQAPTPHQLWRYTSHEAIAWRHITNLGTLLLGSDSGVTSLDLASGAVQWRRTDLARLSDASTWYPPATPYLLIRTDTSWAVVDLATGTTRWDRSKLPFSIIYTAVVIPERRLLLVAGHKAADVPITVAALGIDSGMLRWESDSLLPMSAPPKPPATFLLSPAQPPFLDSDTTAILLPESGGLVRLDTRNGRLLWRQPAVNDDDPPFIRRGYARLAADSGVLYVPAGKRLYAIRIADGTVLWKRDRQYKGVVAQMAMLPQGLFLRISPALDSRDAESFLDLVDPTTGVSRWPKPVKGLDGATRFVLREGTAYLSARKEWIEVRVATDSVREIGPISFQGGEIPWALEDMDSGFVLSSAQNVLSLGPSGNIRWSVYHQAPGASFLSQLAKGVLFVAMDVASVSAVRASGGGLAPVLYPSLGARYRASVNANRYLYLYTSDPPDVSERDGYWLDKVDKTTGEVVGWIKFTDRHPKYMIDGVSGLVLVPVEAEGTDGPGFAALSFSTRVK